MWRLLLYNISYPKCALIAKRLRAQRAGVLVLVHPLVHQHRHARVLLAAHFAREFLAML